MRHLRKPFTKFEGDTGLVKVGLYISLIAALGPVSGMDAAAQTASNPTTQHQHHPAEGVPTLFPPREASGTSWLPDETPMYGVHANWRGWDVMLHGLAFGQFLAEPGFIHRTGGFSTYQGGVVNWGMLGMRRQVGSARVGLRAMASLEAWSLPGCGAINLLATGEMCEGDTIHDRQHPHDLLMELAADYDRPLRGSLRWQLYAGLSGEPALGPSGFPHRLSAMANPIAPIAHHWIDSTHIAFGVVTTGVYGQRWKAEMSVFNGREPDEHRADLDLGALDSVSGRFTFLPSSQLALQVSAGHLNEAEEEFAPNPRGDVDKLTASATYHRPLGDGNIWATTFAYGLSSGAELLPTGSFEALTYALLLETTLVLNDRHLWFGRAELVEKPAHDLHAHAFGSQVFTVGKLQAGYMRQFEFFKSTLVGFGGSAALAFVPSELGPQYDGRITPGFALFVSVRPARHR